MEIYRKDTPKETGEIVADWFFGMSGLLLYIMAFVLQLVLAEKTVAVVIAEYIFPFCVALGVFLLNRRFHIANIVFSWMIRVKGLVLCIPMVLIAIALFNRTMEYMTVFTVIGVLCIAAIPVVFRGADLEAALAVMVGVALGLIWVAVYFGVPRIGTIILGSTIIIAWSVRENLDWFCETEPFGSVKIVIWSIGLVAGYLAVMLSQTGLESILQEAVDALRYPTESFFGVIEDRFALNGLIFSVALLLSHLVSGAVLVTINREESRSLAYASWALYTLMLGNEYLVYFEVLPGYRLSDSTLFHTALWLMMFLIMPPSHLFFTEECYDYCRPVWDGAADEALLEELYQRFSDREREKLPPNGLTKDEASALLCYTQRNPGERALAQHLLIYGSEVLSEEEYASFLEFVNEENSKSEK